MSTYRGQRRSVRHGDQHDSSKAGSTGIQLAPGVRLSEEKSRGAHVLVCPNGKVQLNDSAAAILLLCDGSRSREQLVAEVVRQSSGSTLASDIHDFLDVAAMSGWIIGA